MLFNDLGFEMLVSCLRETFVTNQLAFSNVIFSVAVCVYYAIRFLTQTVRYVYTI